MKLRSVFSSITLLVLAACAPAAPAAPAPPAATVASEVRADRQVARIALAGFPSNPTPQGGTTFAHYYAPLYDTLTAFGPGFSVVPAVAERWNLAPDGLTWTYTLRRDVSWPDGTTLTANDVLFTLDTINQLNWPQRALFPSVRERRVIDPQTIELITSVRDLTIPNNTAQLRIIQKAYFEQVGGFDGFLQKPAGSGPYELVEHRANDVTRFKKRAAKHAFRNPPLDEIIFRVVPDLGQQINGLRLGEIDIASAAFSPEQLETMKRADIQLNVPETTSAHINMPYTAYESRSTPLKDKRVREALNYAIDKDALAKGVYKGFTRPVGQMGTPGSPWWDDSVQPWPFDPKKAKELLAAAGYPNGFKVTYDFVPGGQIMEHVLAIQANLRDVGVEMEIVQLDNASFLDRYFGRAPKSDLFPLQAGESSGFFQSLRNGYTCANGGGQNLGLYCNPEMDKLITDIYAEPDPAKRGQMFKQANRLMRGDVPQIWLVTVNQGVAYSAKVKGIALVPPTQFTFDSVYLIK